MEYERNPCNNNHGPKNAFTRNITFRAFCLMYENQKGKYTELEESYNKDSIYHIKLINLIDDVHVICIFSPTPILVTLYGRYDLPTTIDINIHSLNFGIKDILIPPTYKTPKDIVQHVITAILCGLNPYKNSYGEIVKKQMMLAIPTFYIPTSNLDELYNSAVINRRIHPTNMLSDLGVFYNLSTDKERQLTNEILLAFKIVFKSHIESGCISDIMIALTYEPTESGHAVMLYFVYKTFRFVLYCYKWDKNGFPFGLDGITTCNMIIYNKTRYDNNEHDKCQASIIVPEMSIPGSSILSTIEMLSE